ncbi:hypothetical protein [Paenibacillus macerans]|uniref:hypothetical protein n=1 Tax=Paenibacillus macerans TaxID=44252 RepID=UPI002041E73B|nr:hypothetical protein [Paenibacillus macerans]MCM3699343.1 hypothetical protein [Paenibacillus macerans]
MAKRKTMLFLILSQIVYVLFLAVWLVVLGISAFLSDSPGSAGDKGIRIFLYYLEAYPGGLLLALILSWMFFAKGKWKRSVWWNMLPLLWVIPYIGIMIYAKFS